MCAGALFWAKLGKLVYAAPDEKQGYSRYPNLLHPKTKVVQGPMAEESKMLMQEFFQAKRKKSGQYTLATHAVFFSIICCTKFILEVLTEMVFAL